MRVLIVSDLERSGGAAVAASRLATGLSGLGCDIVRAVAFPSDYGSKQWSTLRVTIPTYRGANRLRHTISPLAEWIDVRSARQQLSKLIQIYRPDAISLHNLHWAPGWNVELVGQASSMAPTTWTLHDMWSFTGRCAYSYDCMKFQTGCDASCPTYSEYPALSPWRIADAWQKKRQTISAADGLTAVCPSRWMANQALSGIWSSRLVEHIPYGLPTDVYRMLDRRFAREALDLPQNTPTLLISADDLTDRRKGMALLAAALLKVTARPLTLAVIGRGQINVDAPGVIVCKLGHLANQRLLVLAYNAADILVHPALADNLPNVVQESMSCGTPVVAFSVGGLPDLVRQEQTGWLAHEVTPEALAEAINEGLCAIASGNDLRTNCRSVCETEYGLDLQASRYLDLFGRMSN